MYYMYMCVHTQLYISVVSRNYCNLTAHTHRHSNQTAMFHFYKYQAHSTGSIIGFVFASFLIGWSLNQPNSCPARAMYGVDVILTDTLQPMILEVQYGPDCAMAVKFNENFWDDILSSLYLGDTSSTIEI
jgi:Tubulin-tyrosine ligase family